MGAAPDATRARLWVAMAANVIVLPGLGSLLAGRRCGWAQAALAASGFALTVTWLSLVLEDWFRAGTLPQALPRLPLLVAGFGLFAAGWLWALRTSLATVRARPEGER